MERVFKNKGLLVKLLTGGLSTILLIAVLWLGTTLYFLRQDNRANEVRANAYRLDVQLLQMRRYEKNFMLYGLTAEEFYEKGESVRLKEHKAVLDSVKKEIENLSELSTDEQNQAIDELRGLINSYEEKFLELAEALREMGFGDYGIEGEWRKAAHDVEYHLEILHDHEVLIELLEMRRNEKDYLLRKDEKYIKELNAHLEILKGHVKGRAGKEYVDALEDLNTYERAFNRYLSLNEKIGITEETGLRGDFRKVFHAIDLLIEEILKDSVLASEKALKNLTRMTVLILFLGLALGSVIFYLFSRSITGRLKTAVNIAEQVASGDLTVNVPSEKRQDEVGVLVQALHRMVGNLQDQTRRIKEGVNSLDSTAREISVSATQIASSASETGTAVSETTTTMDEFSKTAQVSNQKARDVADTAQQTAQISQDGKKATEITIDRMSDIQERMATIGESIMTLSEQSQAIGELIGAVNDLADQSNLLAVNASIEASKAGEQGKGFTVVAQEIRSLAEQSKQATVQVQRILSDIQKATSSVVMAAEQGNKAVEAGVNQSKQAGESILALSSSVMESAQAAAQIAVSSQEQLVGVEQVVTAMENIKQASAQNTASTKQLEATALALTDLGQGLKESADQYKV